MRTQDQAPRTVPRHEEFGAEFRFVQLATFWRNRPKLCFSQLESEFYAYRVRSDEAKYNAVVRYLDEATLMIVSDIKTISTINLKSH